MGYWGYPPYVSVAEKKAKAEKKLKQLKKNNPDIQPVVIKGTSIAISWWGKSWNKNLERYADYSNRIGRGRSYVRNSAVLDLQISSGKVEALVQGTASNPYKVTISIKEISESTWKEIIRSCEGKLDSLQELLAGKFPKALGEVFMAKGSGLFPSPKEISFSCSCPDSAYMCKHVAAALYGVGARLDENPGLFFKLRKADIDELIYRAVEDKTQELLEKAEKKSERVIDDSDLSDMFGIDLDSDEAQDIIAAKKPSSEKQKKVSVKKKVLEKTSVKKGKASSLKNKRSEKKAKPLKKNMAGKKTAKADMSEKEIVQGLIQKSPKGISAAELIKKTGFSDKKIYNIVYRLNSEGKIRKIERGIYSGL